MKKKITRKLIRQMIKNDPEKARAFLIEHKDEFPERIRNRIEKYLQKTGKTNTDELNAIGDELEPDEAEGDTDGSETVDENEVNAEEAKENS